MKEVLFVAVFGSLGAVGRYGVGLWVERTFGGPFPLATLIVNVVGCFALGFLLHWAWFSQSLSPSLRVGLTVGLLGAFTTFSTFGADTMRLWSEGRWIVSLGNIGANLALGLIAIALGLTAAKGLDPIDSEAAEAIAQSIEGEVEGEG